MRLGNVSAALMLLAACGGGGSSNGGGTGPSSMAGVTLISADPPAGSTITLRRECNGLSCTLSAPFSMVLSVVSDQKTFRPPARRSGGWLPQGQDSPTPTLVLPAET